MILRDLPFDKYLELPGINSSLLVALKKSPFNAHFYTQPETTAMGGGNIRHCLELEPDEFFNRYVIYEPEPGISGRRGTKHWQAAQAEAEVSGKRLIKQDEYDAARAEAIPLCSQYRHLMQAPGETELTICGVDSVFECDVKARFDKLAMIEEGPAIVDNKSVARIRSEWGLRKRIDDSGWLIQAAHYVEAYRSEFDKLPAGYFWAIRQSDGAESWVRALNLQSRKFEQAQEERGQLIERYLECQRTGVWPTALAPFATMEWPEE